MLLSEFLESSHASSPFAAVLGYPVAHSRSPVIHGRALAFHGIPVRYYALECPPSEVDHLPDLFSSPAFKGANVTIPLKKKVWDLMHEMDDTARRIGAVNTVVRKSNSQRLKGYNTDAYGFMKPLETYGTFHSAVILGSGGAARAVVYALMEHGCRRILLLSRRSEKHDLAVAHPDIIHQLGYDQLHEAIRQTDLIVNTTPIGMHPDIDRTPVPVPMMPLLRGKVCYDIIYNPPETLLLTYAGRYGARTIGGLDMFLHQAARSFELWFGTSMPLDLVRNEVLTSRNENESSP